MFIDTHCHLNFKAFNKDLPDVIKRAEEAKVAKIIIPGAKIDSSRQAIRIAKKYSCCFAAVGIHPHHVDKICTPPVIPSASWRIRDPNGILKQVQNDKISELIRLATQPKVIAIGEIGLDYHQSKNCPPISESDRNNQKVLFLTQLKIAQESNLPVIIHCRNAHDDLFVFLTDYLKTSNKRLCGVFHCFAGSKTHLKKILNWGFLVGFDGNITYKENNYLRELVKLTPLNLLLLETDAPFLTPCPYRNTRNEPSYVPIIASVIAKIKKQTTEKIAEITSSNATKLFRL